MKVRYGFVSNSSSTSFCIVGNYFTNEELKKVGLIGEDIYDLRLPADIKLDEHSNQCNNGYTIGLSIEKMEDYMKLSDFKEEVKNRLNKIGLKTDSVNINIDGWYDG